MTKADNAVVVTNTKKTVSATGIALSVTPYALLAGLASALGALFFRRKNYLKQSKLNQQETAELKKAADMKKNSDTK
ncbi:MAG: hypothetical protein V8R46_01790 [Eubacterium ramulus]